MFLGIKELSESGFHPSPPAWPVGNLGEGEQPKWEPQSTARSTLCPGGQALSIPTPLHTLALPSVWNNISLPFLLANLYPFFKTPPKIPHKTRLDVHSIGHCLMTVYPLCDSCWFASVYPSPTHHEPPSSCGESPPVFSLLTLCHLLCLCLTGNEGINGQLD